jgi:tRNA threonylcarbamoyl adenosine modification protein YeaZ
VNTAPLYLVLHTNYTSVYIAIFKGNSLIDSRQEDNKRSSRNLIPLLNMMLESYGYTLHDCQFIAANQGPAPFTTLRVVLASANGLAFATRLPLVGVDGLQTFAQEYSNSRYDYTVALLNAFSNDVYFAIHDNNTNKTIRGCTSISSFIEDYLKSMPNSASYQLIGNGVELHLDRLQLQVLGSRVIADPNPGFCSLEAIAQQALKQWNQQENLSSQLLPLYLKEYSTSTKPAIT